MRTFATVAMAALVWLGAAAAPARTGAAEDAATAAPDLADQRKRFVEAERARRRGHQARFLELSGRLRDYPLYPYLVYGDLVRRLHAAPRSGVG